MITRFEGGTMPVLDVDMSCKLGTFQSLGDAIAYRLDRLSTTCPGCGPEGRCTEHARDEELITCYMDRYAAAFSDVLACMGPCDVALMLQCGDGTAPTVGTVGAAMMNQLRKLAASGPVVIELDGRTVLIEPVQSACWR